MSEAYVYIMANQRNGTLYVGATTDLPKRAWEHRNAVVEGFTKRYDCKQLVWYETHPDLDSARLKERRLKRWRRPWKLELIEKMNPKWDDLFETLV